METSQYRVLVLVLLTGPCVVRLQGTGPEATQNRKLYMDQTRDCNGPALNVFDKETKILGQSSTEVQQSPLSCTIELRTENNFEKTTFRVRVNAMKIEDCDVTVAIYDGAPAQPLIDSYDCHKGKGRQDLFTTSNRVSIVLTRRDNKNTQYHIDVIMTPLIAGKDPGYENNWGNDYGYFHNQVPNYVIYSIVGALFVIVIVIIIIVTIHCHRKHKGLTKPPEEYKLSYINNNINSNSTIGRTSRGPVSESSTKKWVNASRENLRREQQRDRKPRHHSDDDGSVFDGSVDSLPSKKRYEHNQSRHKASHYDSRPSYRNDSYVGTDDDHPKKVQIERELQLRVTPKSQKYDLEEAEDAESIGVGPDEEESEEDKEEEETEEETEEEEEEEEEADSDDVDDEADAPRGPPNPPPHELPENPPPRIGHQSKSGLPQPVPQHGHNQPHSYPGQMPVGPGQMNGTPYGPRFAMYPSQPQAVYMPYGPRTGQFQPVQLPAPPVYPGNPNQQPPKPYQVKPSDPPIYSYLVQRGYNPVDGRDSPVSVSTNASAHSDTRLIQPEDSDLSGHNLAAGVEYMRR